ncbi:OprO/OprP family phosphate-selective porin [Aquisediminimonas sediminicola]|uniref:OprO/OprP family phosphate-selective porin n=1 Tax=Alteraquisediminimonas sediminicola TaxID=2676787 RepID=UPI001C8EAC1F|nr:porin [Aquisediminimonas sediminicola]
MIQVDYAGYNARAGGYDYSNGTDIRRARFGFDGSAYDAFKWRLSAEYVKNNVTLLDAYLQYALTPNWSVTIGHVKTPYGLEGVTSDANQTFLEHGMAGNAFTAVGADRRVGAMVSYQSPRLNAALGLFGSGEAIKRSEATPDEGYGVNGRVAYAPILTKGRLLQIGVSGFHATNLAGGTVSIGDRPNVRVDDGKLIEVKSITGIASADSIMAELIGAQGPWAVQGEYGRLKLNRDAGLADLDFDGFYVFGSWIATGETRRVKNGVVEHIKPNADFNPDAGHWGAVELALRYDQLDLTDRGLSPLKRKAVSWTGAINWYLNARATLLFNYIRFRGRNSLLVVTPLVNGTTARGEAFATRLQFDF